jgi:hypothetical protein
MGGHDSLKSHTSEILLTACLEVRNDQRLEISIFSVLLSNFKFWIIWPIFTKICHLRPPQHRSLFCNPQWHCGSATLWERKTKNTNCTALQWHNKHEQQEKTHNVTQIKREIITSINCNSLIPLTYRNFAKNILFDNYLVVIYNRLIHLIKLSQLPDRPHTHSEVAAGSATLR